MTERPDIVAGGQSTPPAPIQPISYSNVHQRQRMEEPEGVGWTPAGSKDDHRTQTEIIRIVKNE